MGDWINFIRFEPLTHFFMGITFLGNEEFLYILLPILCWCWRKRDGFHLFVLAILAAYLNYMLKELFGWERPPVGLWLIGAKGYAFPSSHAVMAVVVWGFLACEVKKKWFTALAVSLIVLIALSRVYLGVHYPQDIAAGVVVGGFSLFAYRWLIDVLEPILLKLNGLVKSAAIIIIGIAMVAIKPTILAATAAGLLAGTVVGYYLEPHFADFDAFGTPLKNIFKSFLGILILLAIWQGFEWVFPSNAGFKTFQFFIMGTWITTGAPWIFVQLKLAQREA